jgi:hypothetical protein
MSERMRHCAVQQIASAKCASLYPFYGYGLANLCGEAVHLSAAALRHGHSRFCEIAQNELLSSGLQARSISIS